MPGKHRTLSPPKRHTSSNLSHQHKEPAEERTVRGKPITLVTDYLLKTVVQEEYKFVEFVHQGHSGTVLAAAGLNSKEPLFVAKVMTKLDHFDQELAALNRVNSLTKKVERWRQEKCPIPTVETSGYLLQPRGCLPSWEDDIMKKALAQQSVQALKAIGRVNPFFVMPRYGTSLQEYFERNKKHLSVLTVLDVGCRVLEQLKFIHAAGLTYNDLKPENILFDFGALKPEPPVTDEDEIRPPPTRKSSNFKFIPKLKRGQISGSTFKDVNMYLIGYGLCKPYKDAQTGRHIAQKPVKTFQGNLRYASSDHLYFQTTGRKDDLISLCYMLVYLLNEGQFMGDLGNSYLGTSSLTKQIEWVRQEKNKMTSLSLCQDRAWVLKPFVEKIFDIKFHEKPAYDDLIHLLDSQAQILASNRQGNFKRASTTSVADFDSGFQNLKFVKLGASDSNNGFDWHSIQQFVCNSEPSAAEDNPTSMSTPPIETYRLSSPSSSRSKSILKKGGSRNQRKGREVKYEPKKTTAPPEESKQKENASCGMGTIMSKIFCRTPTK